MSSNNPNMLKAHVTFDEIKRIISFDKGEDIQGLRYHFIRAFSDVLSDEVAPAGVKFQGFNEHFKDFVELPNEEKLEEDIKVKAIIAPKAGKQQAQGDFPWKYSIPKAGIPWYPDKNATLPVLNKTYRLWNPVHNAILQRNSSTNIVKCDGSLNSTTPDMLVLVKDSGDRNWPFLLFFNTKYVVVGQGAGAPIQTSDSTNPIEGSEFDASRTGAFMMFKNKKYGQYLGCDGNGTAVLMNMENEFFPNPQALFIANMYKLSTTTSA